jgi:hypothetical protein
VVTTLPSSAAPESRWPLVFMLLPQLLSNRFPLPAVSLQDHGAGQQSATSSKLQGCASDARSPGSTRPLHSVPCPPQTPQILDRVLRPGASWTTG